LNSRPGKSTWAAIGQQGAKLGSTMFSRLGKPTWAAIGELGRAGGQAEGNGDFEDWEGFCLSCESR